MTSLSTGIEISATWLTMESADATRTPQAWGRETPGASGDSVCRSWLSGAMSEYSEAMRGAADAAAAATRWGAKAITVIGLVGRPANTLGFAGVLCPGWKFSSTGSARMEVGDASGEPSRL